MNLEQRIAQLSPTKLALLELNLKKRASNNGRKPSGDGVQRRQQAQLSFSQERLWFLEQMDPGTSLYNLPAVMPLHGNVDVPLVEQCVRKIVARHSSLRTRFVVKDDNPYQTITDNLTEALDFATVDLRIGVRQLNGQSPSQRLNSEIWKPFNLATGPLLRVRLILQPNSENLLLVVMHHIVSDGWSINIFIKEFRMLYEAGHSSLTPDLPDLPLQYIDYSLSERQGLTGERLQSLLSYWRVHLEGAPPLLELPLDRPRPARQTFKGALHSFTVPHLSLQKVKTLCRECGVVPFMVLLSAFKVLLYRYTNQSKIVVGTPIANRNRSEYETVIGFFANTLVLCSSFSSGMTFRELLAQVRDTTLKAYDHQELPFEKLVSELQPERNLRHNPLFQVMFIFQNLPTEKAIEGETGPPGPSPPNAESLEVRFSKFDLTLAMTEENGRLLAVFEYATDLFETATVERMAGHFLNILECVLQNPDQQLNGFCFLSEGEKRLMLAEWNDTVRQWPEILPLHGRFEKWARQTPNATALIFQGTAITYKELEQRANIIANFLRREGIDRGSIVGICLFRSVEMVVALFAILKAGGAYMPIDPDFPEERIAYMLNDAKTTHVLTVADLLPKLAPHQVHAIALDTFRQDRSGDDSPTSVCLASSDLAYVLFTSGSTGEPKGVMISHGAIYNRLQWMQERYQLETTGRVMQKTPFTFDVSVWEFFWPLSEGASLVIADPERHKESAYLVALIKKEQVNCLHFVPSMLQLFLHEDIRDCASLSRIICSGEALTVEQCRRLRTLPEIRAHNLYGPTEAAVDVTHWDCSQWRDDCASVPIGRPIANTQIYILNECLQPSPIGVPGELYIGGHNLADGYLNKPGLTAKRFIANPFGKEPDRRLYKTGDLARFRSDGNIEYIGRLDSQVKLRGLRIELGEIESILRQYPGIVDAIVVVHRFDDHDERLVAYIVLEDSNAFVDTDAIGSFLSKKLPNYMVPHSIMTIPKVPMTPNGKLDRKNLPTPIVTRISKPKQPLSEIERELIDIWRKFLKVEALDMMDDFFAMGGHSILVTQVINSVNGRYHLNVPVRLLFENPTVQTFAKALSEFEDEAWLEESRTAAAILTHSRRRLLQTLDELTEEQIDEFLIQHFDDPGIEFSDIESLLAWSHNSSTLDDLRPAAQPASEPGLGLKSERFSSAYVKCYIDLSRVRFALDHIHLRQRSPLLIEPSPDGYGNMVAELREQAAQVFQSYVGEVQRRFREAEEGSEVMIPEELYGFYHQLMNLASLAASIKVV